MIPFMIWRHLSFRKNQNVCTELQNLIWYMPNLEGRRVLQVRHQKVHDHPEGHFTTHSFNFKGQRLFGKAARKEKKPDRKGIWQTCCHGRNGGEDRWWKIQIFSFAILFEGIAGCSTPRTDWKSIRSTFRKKSKEKTDTGSESPRRNHQVTSC